MYREFEFVGYGLFQGLLMIFLIFKGFFVSRKVAKRRRQRALIIFV